MKNKKNIIIGILVVLPLTLITCTGCDIFNKDKTENNNLNDNNQETTNNNSSNSEVDYRFTSMSDTDWNNLNEEVKSNTEQNPNSFTDGVGFDILDFRYMLMQKMKYIPLKENSFSVSDLTDEDIREYIWIKVAEDYSGKRISKDEVNRLLKENFNKTNYEVKTGETLGGYLKLEQNEYVVDEQGPYDYNMPIINRIEYDEDTKEVNAYFESYHMTSAISSKNFEGIAVFKIYYNEYKTPYFVLDRIEKNK